MIWCSSWPACSDQTHYTTYLESSTSTGSSLLARVRSGFQIDMKAGAYAVLPALCQLMYLRIRVQHKLFYRFVGTLLVLYQVQPLTHGAICEALLRHCIAWEV